VSEPTLIAIDPGPSESAYVVLRGRTPIEAAKVGNYDLLAKAEDGGWYLAIEMVQSFGKPVGAEVFETCVWVGRYIEAFGRSHTKILRHEVKMHLCHATKGVNDSVIRQRLIDLYGGKAKAIGKKKTPGPLYGIKADCWQALACGIVYLEKYHP
jgi:hypothetical protein